MTKSLASYPEEKRLSIAMRRVRTLTKGNGYWGAVAYLEVKGKKIPKPNSSPKERVFSKRRKNNDEDQTA